MNEINDEGWKWQEEFKKRIEALIRTHSETIRIWALAIDLRVQDPEND